MLWGHIIAFSTIKCYTTRSDYFYPLDEQKNTVNNEAGDKDMNQSNKNFLSKRNADLVMPIEMFKEINILFFIFCFTTVIVMYIATRSFPITMLGFFAVVLIVGLLATIWANKRLKKISDVLRRDCDPHLYIAELSEILYQQRRVSNYNYILLQLSTGYISINDTKTALRYLNIIYLPDDTADRTGISIGRYNNLVSCYLQCGDLDAADRYLEKMNQLIKKQSPDKAFLYTKWYTDKLYKRLLAKGEYEGCAQYFSSQADLESFLYRKVDYQYHLALALILDGNQDKARVALEYVVTNGNKLSHHCCDSIVILNFTFKCA